MGGLGVVTDGFEREIGLDAGGDIECPVMEQRPAAVPALNAPQVDPYLRLQVLVDAREEMLQQNVLRRDRRIGLEFEYEMAV